MCDFKRLSRRSDSSFLLVRMRSSGRFGEKQQLCRKEDDATDRRVLELETDKQEGVGGWSVLETRSETW